MTEVATNHTTASQRIATAARVFARQHETLNAADQARLRREEVPAALAAFWICFNPAQKEAPKLSLHRCEALLPLLTFWPQAADDDDQARTVGHRLRAHRDKITLRRVESLFSARDSGELLEELTAIAAILKGETIDYGQLYSDLGGFDRWRGDVLRRWARAYFSN